MINKLSVKIICMDNIRKFYLQVKTDQVYTYRFLASFTTKEINVTGDRTEAFECNSFIQCRQIADNLKNVFQPMHYHEEIISISSYSKIGI